jgi:hypothetical protein
VDWTQDLKGSTSTLPIEKTHYEVHLRQPEPVYSPLYFLEQSFGLVWLSVAVTLAVLSLTMWAMVKCLNHFKPEVRPITLVDAVTENISAFSGQGFNVDVKSLAYRAFVLVALLWNMMMSISFSTNLVSYFCAQNAPPTKYTNLIDLLESGEYSLCTMNIHYEIYEILHEVSVDLSVHCSNSYHIFTIHSPRIFSISTRI